MTTIMDLTSEQLWQFSDDQLIEILRKEWGYSKGEPFEVIGQIQPINHFWILDPFYHRSGEHLLSYPNLDDTKPIRNTIYIGSINTSVSKNQWVKIRVELSPLRERKKHENPFDLCAVSNSLTVLEVIPEMATSRENISQDTISQFLSIDGQHYVEKCVLDYYTQKNQEEIKKQTSNFENQLKNDFESQERLIQQLKTDFSELDTKYKRKNTSFKNLKIKVSETSEKLEKLEAHYINQQIQMENQLNTLNNFIEKQATILSDLELISQDELNQILGTPSSQNLSPSHHFINDFDGSLPNAIKYIQAYLFKQGIIYQQSVLEDFCALLMTHDLIILAGDSGSGKTNLVKSFAKAVNGRAVIIPVKPNWTSAEDLLGYYNPLEQKYLSTLFLDTIIEANKNPNIPYFICLDEMNLARVEYYFADFLSLMEERDANPQIPLYSTSEAELLTSEVKNFIALIDEAKIQTDSKDISAFIDILKNEELNLKLSELCGFKEGDSLLKYHVYLKRLLGNYFNTPSQVTLPPNVRIIGAINVDETTYYLSPKILDRAHIMKFKSPLLLDWDEIENELEDFDLDLSLPVDLSTQLIVERKTYPVFDRNLKLTQQLIDLAKNYLDPMGVEFGLRTIRQALNYQDSLLTFTEDQNIVFNNFILHKILPKLMFDGEKSCPDGQNKKDKLKQMKDYIEEILEDTDLSSQTSCISELELLINNAESNDWVVNYWSK
ncbi:McrB family protein [Wohlfahrtiimonas chitiniclastica]|uniref:McrB family protein n=1 Tax=Wohlfahrtiimonas chitiniclastica TaxID=400946 RepID=UPI000B9979BD|nr:AAA family ATPase [Wohlfahrtiimonas chitiniclastica]MBS7836445.1 AAA family ATPase [Wohlfahrtiimonas chitiniclastica]OYQ76130.1 hypothetical protein B9T18_01870 [Wohlfahrtiimonas chitiniclastica]